MANYFIQDVALAKGLARLSADLQVGGLITNYTNEAVQQNAKFAQSILVPILGKGQAKDKLPGVSVVPDAATSTPATILINKHKTYDVFVPDADALFTQKGYLDRLLEDGARAIAEQMEADFLSTYVNAGTTIGAPKGGASANLIRAVKKASRKNLWRQNAPKYIVWGPEGEDDLLGDSLFVNANERGDQQGVVNGTIDRKFGFNHLVSNLTPEVAGSPGAEHGLAFQSEGIGFAMVPMDGMDLPAEVKDRMGVYMRAMTFNDDQGRPVYTMRFIVGYDQKARETILTVDTMYGVKVVRPELVMNVLV
jgi:hypothetical protein